MIQPFNIVHSFGKVDKNIWFQFVSGRDRVTRNNSDELNLIKPNAKLEIRRNFYSRRQMEQREPEIQNSSTEYMMNCRLEQWL